MLHISAAPLRNIISDMVGIYPRIYTKSSESSSYVETFWCTSRNFTKSAILAKKPYRKKPYRNKAKMKVAIQGCCHGQLDSIYDSISKLEKGEGMKVDLLLICGDFQSVRNAGDMDCMASPEKYHQIGTFYKYYSGEKLAPCPTIFIGGNHEASNYLWELYHGGWVCENIYFLGFAGVVRFGDLRIGGLSGIYNERHFHLGHFETSPYSSGPMRSIYHTRNYDIFKLMNLTGQLDIFLSHDWPLGITHYGNTRELLAKKPHFRSEIDRNTLGSPPAQTLLHNLRPRFWFSAHMHVKFAAVVNHLMASSSVPPAKEVSNPDEIAIDIADIENMEEGHLKDIKNPDSIEIDDDFDDDIDLAATSPEKTPQDKIAQRIIPPSQTNTPSTSQPANSITRFLALDKCLPNRDFLQIIDIPIKSNLPLKITYDEEWLAITKAAHPYLSLTSHQAKLPAAENFRRDVVNELENIRTRLAKNEITLDLPSFSPTAPAHIPDKPLLGQAREDAKHPYLNPQTTYICDLLGIDNKINPNGKTSEHLPKDDMKAQSTPLQEEEDFIVFEAGSQENKFSALSE